MVAPPQPWQPPVTEQRTWSEPWWSVVVPSAEVEMGTVKWNKNTVTRHESRLIGGGGDDALKEWVVVAVVSTNHSTRSEISALLSCYVRVLC